MIKKMPTKFQQKVYDLLRRVPKGKVTTYKNLAQALNTGAYQAIGNALNKNPCWPEVPCHRVVNSDGRVGGFARGTKEKIRLLTKEGIKINKDKIEDINKIKYEF